MRKFGINASLVALMAVTPVTYFAPAPVNAAAPEGDHKHGEGEMHKLGRQKIGDFTVSVIMKGEAEAGKTAEFDIKLIEPKSEPKAMRVWIGSEDAKGSEKATATKKEKTYDADVKVPSPLPAGAKVWVELETDAGVVTGSYSLEEGHGDHKH